MINTNMINMFVWKIDTIECEINIMSIVLIVYSIKINASCMSLHKIALFMQPTAYILMYIYTFMQ